MGSENRLLSAPQHDSPVADYIRQRANSETITGLWNTLLGTGMMSGGIALSGTGGLGGLPGIPLSAYGGKVLADGLGQQWNGMKLSGAAPMWNRTDMQGYPQPPDQQLPPEILNRLLQGN